MSIPELSYPHVGFYPQVRVVNCVRKRAPSNIAHVFDEVSDHGLLEAIGEAAQVENCACARRLAAIAELYRRRGVDDEDHDRRHWRIDPWDAVAAEVAAAQSITAGSASSLLHIATCLYERLPKVAEVFATGVIDLRLVRMIVNRTLLAIEPEVMEAIDHKLADAISGWGPLSLYKAQVLVDRVVQQYDPLARRRADMNSRSRHVDISHNSDHSYISGMLLGSDATVLDRRLTAMARSVCDDDPRTAEQRRADALGALAAGQNTLMCACASPACSLASSDSTTSPSVIIHVVTDAAAMESADPADIHGERSDDNVGGIITSRQQMIDIITAVLAIEPDPPPPLPLIAQPPRSGLIIGGGTVPVNVLADLSARGIAQVRNITHPQYGEPEPGYRPSVSLADYIRCRDLTCRFPGCAHPADLCDIDHTIAYSQGGATHASNLKCLCRKHHLLKTFWNGPTGWSDEQLPDGVVVWTSPSGHTYQVKPASALLVPQLQVTTAPWEKPEQQTISPHRGVMMPTRSRTRAAHYRSRIITERNLNQHSLA